MQHRFDLLKILSSAVGYKGLPFPGIGRRGTIASAGNFEIQSEGVYEEYTSKGTLLRSKDVFGRWEFMPISIIADGEKYDLPYAVMNITGKKTIVETPLIGRKGSVKELISIDDYKVSIVATLVGENGAYPETLITRFNALYNANEPVELISAFTDLIFDENDKVVITDIAYPATVGVEDAQLVKIECVTDKPFELIVR